MIRLSTLFLVCLMLVTAVAPVQADDVRQSITPFSVTFADLGYNDLTLEGLNAVGSFWVPFQPNWSMEDTEIEIVLDYATSPLMLSDYSTLTIAIEDNAVTSFVPTTDGNIHSETFTISGSQVPSNLGFTLQILGFLAIDDDPCQEFDNPAQWLRIVKTSTITYAPAYETGAPILNDITNRFAMPDIFQGKSQNLFVLPDTLDPETLTAAAQVAARLGQQARYVSYTPVTAVKAGELTPEQREEHNLVIVGTPDALSFLEDMSDAMPVTLSDGAYVTPDSGSVPSEIGVIQTYSSPVNPVQLELLVSGARNEGVVSAGQAFGHTPTFNAFDGNYQLASELLPAQTSDLAGAWSSALTSFAQLRIPDITVRGIGTFQHYITFRYPPGWEFTNGTTLILDLATSPILSADQSYIAVFINDVPIGTVRTGANTPVQVQFDVPQSALNLRPTGERPQQAVIRFEVSNYIDNEEETCNNDEIAWTTIASSSRFDVRYEYLPTPDLQIFPYPFVADNAVSPTVIVIPTDPTSQELSLALSLASTLGRFTPTDLNLQLVTADMVDDELLADSQLIIIGTTERQSLFDQFSDEINGPHNADLYFASSTGFVQEIRSPFNSDRVALLVYGATDIGVEKAVDILLDAAPPVFARGTFMFVEETGVPQLIDPQIDLEALFPAPIPSPTATPAQEEVVTPPDPATPESPAATPAPETGAVIDDAGDMVATDENALSEDTLPLEDDQSFVVISVAAIIMIPFAFLFTRQRV